MTDALTFEKIWKEYDDKIVLEDVSVSIAEGAFVSLIGPSGAGKSTFLRLVLGQEAPSRGQIKFFGKPLRAEPGPDRPMPAQVVTVGNPALVQAVMPPAMSYTWVKPNWLMAATASALRRPVRQ